MQEEIDKLNEIIRELQCNVNDLQEKLDNQEEIVNTFPKRGETYYYISSTGTIIEDYYEGSMFDIKVTEFGNCFRTKEEAEKAVEKLKALKRLRDKGFKFCGSDDQTISYRVRDWDDEADEDIALLFDKEENTNGR